MFRGPYLAIIEFFVSVQSHSGNFDVNRNTNLSLLTNTP